MNKTTKTILIVIGSLLVLCGCAAAVLLGTGLWSFGKFVQVVDSGTTENPQEVAQIAAEIADFEAPDGFPKQYGMQLAGITMVQYMTQDENTVIFVTEFPAGTSINVNEMLRQIRNNSGNPNSRWYNVYTKLVEQKPVTIRGEETTLSINEGTSDQGELYRMANATFQGDGDGPAVLMIIGPADQWDTGMMESFIASIR